MAKRFIDTETLLRPSIRVCPTPYKLFWMVLLTRSDHAGIWVKDMEMANLLVGTKIDPKKALEFFDDKIVQIDNGRRWFIPDFIDFQYPSGLNPKNNAHISAIKILIKYGLWDEEKMRVSVDPNIGLQVGSQDMVKVKEKEKVKEKVDQTLVDYEIVEPEVMLPWQTETFKAQWQHWKIYKKKEHKFNYKTVQSEQAALTELANLSDGNEKIGIAIIHQSLANGWKGFFKLKQNKNGNWSSTNTKSDSEIKQSVNHAVDELLG
ncbi:MAG: hypothetical protein AAF348_11540 [Bacteroidota bacterium]